MGPEYPAVKSRPTVKSMLRVTCNVVFLPCVLLVIGCGSSGRTTTGVTPGLAIPAADGTLYQPLMVAPGDAAVLIFILQDCPICSGYAPEIQRIAADFAARGVRFYLVQVDPALSDIDARRHAMEFGYGFPVLMDREHKLVRRLGVIAVPTAVVLGPGGVVRYEGRIDDRYSELARPRQITTTHELRDALAAVMDGKSVANARTKVIGCAVPELPDSAAGAH